MRSTILFSSVLWFSVSFGKHASDKDARLHKRGGITNNYLVATVPLAIPAQTKLAGVDRCDTAHPKSEINRFLKSCNSVATTRVQNITQGCKSVNSGNSRQIGLSVAVELQGLVTLFQTNVAYIQSCGMDPKPLSEDQGVSLDAVSNSAFVLVETLAPAYVSIAGLYKTFPAIQETCSLPLTNVSTSFASIIGTCGEQINLFESEFFKLVTSHMSEYSSLSNNFLTFMGTF